MTLDFVFWFLMLLWAIFGVYWGRPHVRNYPLMGTGLLLFILFVVVGLRVFGFPIKG